MNYLQTVNELRFQLQERNDKKFSHLFYKRPSLFKVGDTVEFMFNGLKKIGRVTNSICRNNQSLYNIETNAHQWFQKINQRDIVAKIG